MEIFIWLKKWLLFYWVYHIIVTRHTHKEINMSAEKTVEALKSFCTKNSGDIFGQTWNGNKATYHWNIGKYTANGTLNGVVRKLAGVQAGGEQIWVVAGSFKISADGTILRFTGLPKKHQKEIGATLAQPIIIAEPVVA
jgi:hypothetical protein